MPHTPPPLPDDTDDDLAAYLDGELDPTDAEKVEADLATDPAARKKASELKKSFALLDYLPTSEPSPNFTNRTVTALQPALAASGSRPVPTVPAPLPRKRWPEVLAWTALALAAASLGFAGHHASRQTAPKPPEELPLSDVAVIEALPLLAGADDLDFVRGLMKDDLFESPSADADLARRDPPSAAERQNLIEQFRALPTTRQQQLRTLHAKLTDPTTTDRTALVSTLEAYAGWLARLPDDDRRRVFDARPERRREVVRQVWEDRWQKALPQKQQDALKHVASEEAKQELLAGYRATDAAHRDEWELAQRQWKKGTRKDKDGKPWPFHDPNTVAEVDRFILSAFGIDPKNLPPADKDKRFDKFEMKSECRLTREEVIALRDKREAAEQGGYWFLYGAYLLQLADRYPTLPRWGNGKLTPLAPKDVKGYTLPKEKDAGKLRAGKWPDFAEDVARSTREAKEATLPPLGPCRPDEFTPAVQQFIEKSLTDADRKSLERYLGKWPDYPREMMKLAERKNLRVPEVTLPGEPAEWREHYRPEKK